MTLPILNAAAVGTPITRQGIAFFPIFLPDNELPPIATGEDSGLEIDELEVPSVQELRMTNPTDRPILVVDGEHFLGGKQNRTANSAVLVGAKSELVVPVSCLEQGRWGQRRSWRRADFFAPAHVRAVQRAGVARSLRRTGTREGDQRRVWMEVDATLNLNGIDSETAAASDLERAYRRECSCTASVQEVAVRGPLPRQCGVAVARRGRVTAMDLFGAPHLLAAHWEQIVRSHFVEPPQQGSRVSCDGVQKLIRRVARAPTEAIPGIGLGVEHHIAEGRLTGQALTLNGALVHAAFSQEEVGERGKVTHGHAV